MYTLRDRQFNANAAGRIPVSRMPDRRGLSLLLVMVAISTSLVLTLAFVKTQTIALQLSRNSARRDFALQAAQTGAAVALERLQSPDWTGVQDRPSRTIHADTEGTSSFEVVFEPVSPDDPRVSPEATSLHLRIQSTGVWQSNGNNSERVERQVEVVVQLQPRVPGRPMTAGDSAAANDVAANPGDYDQIQQYSLFGGSGTNSLVLEPQSRIDGDLWLEDRLEIYKGPGWAGAAQNDLLQSIGERFGPPQGSSVFQHPHPLAGKITFYQAPGKGHKADFARLKTPWESVSNRLTLPAIDVSAWQEYFLYEGGFPYEAVQVDSFLQNVELRPTPENPLGIFYRVGSVTLGDGTLIQGTLVVDGTVTVYGKNVMVTAFDWRSEGGASIVANQEYWPRLPAIVADTLSFDPQSRARIEGAVVAQNGIQGAGGQLEYPGVADVKFNGTATASPLRQPQSLVQLQGTRDLSLLSDSGDYSIWLDDGGTGSWYAIIGIDPVKQQLTVSGEVNQTAPTVYRIRRSRLRFVDIRGPVSGQLHSLGLPEPWRVISGSMWDVLHDIWTDVNEDRDDDDQPPIPFVDWLDNPQNFPGWPYPYSVYGLPLEPTFHLRNTDGINHRWSPPLFDSFSGTGSDEEFSGYRWKVVSWRELP